MKKILFIAYTHSMGGGAEKILTDVVNGLAMKTDYEISVLEYAKFDIKKCEFNEKIKVLPPIVDMTVSSKLEKVLKYFAVHICPWALRKLYIKEKYDVEISFNYQIPSFLTSSSKNVYNIQWNHGDIYDLKSNRFKCFLQGRSFKKADRIVAISKNTEKSIVDLFPKDKEKIRMVYNGTNLDAIKTSSQENTDIFTDKNSILFIGRLEPQKDPLRLIQYVEKLNSEGIKVKLYLLGTGVQEKEIDEYIEKSGTAEFIKRLGYIQNPCPLIKQSAAICMLSKSEGFPTVFTEGMALGVPFISTPVGGTQELADNGNCGVIVDDYEEFKSAVLNVVFNNENNKKMGLACIERMRLFSYDKQIEDTIKLIEKKI